MIPTEIVMTPTKFKKVKSREFLKGLGSGLGLVLAFITITYLVSGFGDRYEYQIQEPDFDLPVLREDPFLEDGDVDGSDADVKIIEE